MKPGLFIGSGVLKAGCRSVSCPSCGSTDLDGISRITDYMSKLSSWNKGKIGELHDRLRSPIQA